MRRPVTILLGILVGVSLVTASSGVGAQESVEDARTQREEARREKAAAAAELDAAKAEDAALADALGAITVQVNAQQLRVDESIRQLGELEGRRSLVQAELALSAEAEASLNDELVAAAVATFLSGSESDLAILEADSILEALRQNELSDQVNANTSDLLDGLREVKEDQDILKAELDASIEAQELIEAELDDRLAELGDAQGVQAELKAEVEVRVAMWEAEFDDAVADEAELTAFIQEEERKAAAAAAAAATAASGGSSAPKPSNPSVSGFQWPISGSVSSGFGYRIHPIYGTKRLHAGIDIGASSGTPIAAANGGTVIYAGWRGGYGKCVIISHGDGISSLYAHQSSIAASNGATVSRGDIIGYIGSTGQSTGPHLHFEIRSNGTPIDPMPYLP